MVFDKKNIVIGVLGGMGTYATIDFFERYAETFPAQKEWDRPRIIIDNNCTMPSRVRAYLYGERVEELVQEMEASIRNLMAAGCNRIILACNTSHLFLEKVFERCPEARHYVVNIIDICVEKIKKDRVEKVFLLATEGTILSGVYNEKLERRGISCQTLSKDEFPALRSCIEAVKQNEYSDAIGKIFKQLLGDHAAVILGCTELPILYKLYVREPKARVYDPLALVLRSLKNELKNG